MLSPRTSVTKKIEGERFDYDSMSDLREGISTECELSISLLDTVRSEETVEIEEGSFGSQTVRREVNMKRKCKACRTEFAVTQRKGRSKQFCSKECARKSLDATVFIPRPVRRYGR